MPQSADIVDMRVKMNRIINPVRSMLPESSCPNSCEGSTAMPQPARSITLPRTGVDKCLQPTRRDHRGVHIHLGVGVSASRAS